MSRSRFVVATLLVALLTVAHTTHAQQSITLDPPAAGFVLDAANVLSADDEQAINTLSQQLSDQLSSPIVVVTIDSMADHWRYGDIRIETFAHLLFDQWQIGPVDPNRGMLLVVSQGDRKARIQLGDGWGRSGDAESTRIMDRRIIPRFKRGDFAAGIMAGVNGLSEMAQGDAGRGSSSSSTTAAPPPTSGGSSNPPITLPGDASHGEISQPSMRGVVYTALGCGGVILLIVLSAFVLFRASQKRNSFRSYRNRLVDEDGRAHAINDDNVEAAAAASSIDAPLAASPKSSESGILGGLLQALLFSGLFSGGGSGSSWTSHSGSRRSSGFGRSSSSSFGRSFGGGSSFGGGGGFSGGGGGGGGGFSGGGGATGSW